jgi:hypothetical protein
LAKTSPADNAIDQPMSPNLSWTSSSAVAIYEYCFDKTLDSFCNSGWVSVNLVLNINPENLDLGSIYEWQVRETNLEGSTEADCGIWWQLTTVPEAPGEFNKSSPVNNAIDQLTSPELNWESSARATRYEYCLDTSNNSMCDTIGY